MQVHVVKSSRKSVAMRVLPDGTLEVRAPLRMTEREITGVVQKNAEWEQKQLAAAEEKRLRLESEGMLTKAELDELAEQAVRFLPDRVKYFAEKIGVTYGKITVRNQKSKWGSCSGKGNLNFNCLMMLTPPEVRDYLIVHELCHRREMNHSARFWAEVEKVLPDYRERERWLKQNGADIIMRMTGL